MIAGASLCNVVKLANQEVSLSVSASNDKAAIRCASRSSQATNDRPPTATSSREPFCEASSSPTRPLNLTGLPACSRKLTSCDQKDGHETHAFLRLSHHPFVSKADFRPSGSVSPLGLLASRSLTLPPKLCICLSILCQPIMENVSRYLGLLSAVVGQFQAQFASLQEGFLRSICRLTSSCLVGNHLHRHFVVCMFTPLASSLTYRRLHTHVWPCIVLPGRKSCTSRCLFTSPYQWSAP